MLISRETLNSEINEFINNDVYTKSLLIIKGVYGVGKTTFLNQFRESNLKEKLWLVLDFSEHSENSYLFLKKTVEKFVDESGIKFKTKKFESSEFFKSLLSNFGLNGSLAYTEAAQLGVKSELHLISILKSIIASKFEYYSASIRESDKDHFPIILARMVKEICQTSNFRLFLILDECEEMNYNSSIFIEELLKSDIKISLLCSMKEDIGTMDNKYFSTVVVQYMLEKSGLTNYKQLPINSFSEDETALYISQKYNRNFEKSDEMIQNIHNLSGGLPLILNVISSNCSLNELELNGGSYKITEIESLELLYNRVIDSVTESQNKILWYVALSGGFIDEDVLGSILDELNIINYASELGRMQRKNLLVYDEDNNCFKIKYTLISNYMCSSSLKSNYEKKAYYKRILKGYLDLVRNKKNEYIIMNLYWNLKRYQDFYQSAINYTRSLVKNGNPDNAIQIIDSILKKQISDEYQANIIILKSILIEANYSVKEFKNCTEIYKSFTSEEFSMLKIEKFYYEMVYTVAKAYYYQNSYINSIECMQMLLKEVNQIDRNIYHNCMLLLSSAYDLCGDFNNSIRVYNEGAEKAAKETDYYAQGLYHLSCQMVAMRYDECIDKLEKAVSTFRNSKIHVHKLAYSLNNLGIEQLMGGESKLAFDNLEESLNIFEKTAIIEQHFVQNNLGLYYYFIESPDLARIHLLQALKGAMSPLQYAYVNNNLGVCFMKYDVITALKYFQDAEKSAQNCPDPVVYSNIYYNLARYYFINKNMTKVSDYLKKGRIERISKHPQYMQLKYKYLYLMKRSKEGNKSITNNNFKLSLAPNDCDRRLAFYNSEWQLGELMFYN
ncbi:hypothetical protein GH810_06575 [Acetobacterium paludosum]|uniref:Tetratricopeptide repeat protein n=1 Tax=Acetobacterium paludosum TaxID=52693 RepID=A0A923KWE4_9FIRM|nr:tetratricopeptide repeat protein [Acetobacterium paludosum]MBC3887973.1 hypothetical protein [Acetobacterium paludosum]